MRIDRVQFAAALAREDLNLKRLAELTGLSRPTIQAVKSGKSCSEGTGRKLAAILGKDIIEKE